MNPKTTQPKKARVAETSRIAAIQIRGRAGIPTSIAATLRTLRLGKKFSMAVHEPTPSVIGLLKVASDYITWGELNQDVQRLLQDRFELTKTIRLRPPIKGFKSTKTRWPKGDLGYRGDKINELIKRMIK